MPKARKAWAFKRFISIHLSYVFNLDLNRDAVRYISFGRDDSIYGIVDTPHFLFVLHIFGFGEWGFKINESRINQTPWIFKMSTAGDMLWEHAYYEMKADGIEAKYGLFFDAVELDDGSIIAVGGMDTGNNDILIARFDSEGCLMFGCELLNDVTDILSDVEDVALASGISVHPNPSISGAQVEVSIDAAIHSVGNYIFEVYNAMGELVCAYDLKVGQQSIQIEAGKGLYYVRIKNESEILFSAKHIIL